MEAAGRHLTTTRWSGVLLSLALVTAGCSATPGSPSTSVPSIPASPAGPSMPAATGPATATPLPTTAGLSLSSAFQPAFTLTYAPDQWNVLDDHQPRDVFLQYASTGDALQFLRPDNLPKTPCDPSSTPGADFPTVPWAGSASDFIAWLQKAGKPALTLTHPEPVSVGNAAGLQVELTGKGSAGCQFLRISRWGSDNALRISTAEPPSRLFVLDVHGQTVTIWFHGWGPDTVGAAMDLLSTVEFQ